jgi:hypothetical protein
MVNTTNILNYCLLSSGKSVTSPDDVLKITSGINYDNFTEETDYIVKSPSKVMSSKLGVCYDIVELERRLFNAINYEFKTFFTYEKLPIDDNRTHTFLIFKENKKYFWFESSWQSMRAIHGSFSSYSKAVNYVKKFLLKDNWKSVFKSIKYKKFNYKGMNLNEFGEYIVDNF